MMKKRLIAKAVVLLSAVSSSTVMAHAGHVADESLHGPLHGEHLLALLAVGVVIVAVKGLSRKK